MRDRGHAVVHPFDPIPQSRPSKRSRLTGLAAISFDGGPRGNLYDNIAKIRGKPTGMQEPRPALVNQISEAELRDVDRGFYHRSWTRSELPWVASLESASWIIFMDPLGLGRQISIQLSGAAHKVIEVSPGKSFARLDKGRYLIRPGARADIDALITDVRKRGDFPNKIVHLWSVSGDSSDAPTDETLNLSFYSLLNLAHALSAQHLFGVDIATISNCLQSVSGEPIVKPLRATLLGPTKVIPKNFPGITCRSIDCDPVGQGIAYVAVQIIAEHCAPFSDSVVAYRGDERWIESLERTEFAGDGQVRRLKQKGVYLITGGLGDHGLAVAKNLARNFRARLVLVDRTPFPPAGEWQEQLRNDGTTEAIKQVIRKLLEIQSLSSELTTICADVTRLDEMKQAMTLARKQFGSINGVIHSAGVTENSVVPSKVQANGALVLNLKIKATLVLAEALGDASLDFLALFSSANSVFPSGEEIDHVATNCFLDAFATSRRGALVVAVHCEPWLANPDERLEKPIGAAAVADSLQTDLIRQGENGVISPRLAAEALEHILLADTLPTMVVIAHCGSEMTVAAKPTRGQCTGRAASKDEVEALLVGWWQELLNREHIDLDADFFELGGDSLLGAQLFSKIKKTYGLKISLSTLFEARTVRDLGQLIGHASRDSSHGEPRPWSPIVPIQPKGTRAPLYVISGLGANVIKFHNLAFHLGKEQPMYGLLPRGMDGKDSYHARIEAIAGDYVVAIRAIQPAGPYYLVGYSFGGIVAFEVAQQITAQGGEVRLLGLFDALEWHYMEKVKGSLRMGQRFQLLREHIETILFSEDRVSYFKTLVSVRYAKIKFRLSHLLGRELPQKFGSIEEVNCYAADRYYPKAYAGRLTLFRSTKKTVFRGDDDLLGWGALAGGGLDVHEVPSTHFNFLKEPAVRVLAEKLHSCLVRESPPS